VETDPPARSFKWKFNNSGETLEVSPERFSASSNGTMSILRYTPVTEMGYGTLSCWAQNAIGMQTSPCVFQVVAAGKMSAAVALFTAFFSVSVKWEEGTGSNEALVIFRQVTAKKAKVYRHLPSE
jgi:hypothetical protein